MRSKVDAKIEVIRLEFKMERQRILLAGRTLVHEGSRERNAAALRQLDWCIGKIEQIQDEVR